MNVNPGTNLKAITDCMPFGSSTYTITKNTTYQVVDQDKLCFYVHDNTNTKRKFTKRFFNEFFVKAA